LSSIICRGGKAVVLGEYILKAVLEAIGWGLF
jgi:hypothetical protein